ncbi:MAG: hypothetical protein RI953_1165 [Pseudomonadota bacterium]|jgi:hypothetical protein
MAELHSEVTSKEFRMDRRQLLKWTAAAVAVGKFMNFQEALAAGECTQIGNLSDLNKGLEGVSKILSSTNAAAAKNFLYWIDGPMNAALNGFGTSQTTRARLSCTMHLQQSSNSFIETVILADASYNIIAQQFYNYDSRLPVGSYAPYTVFENLPLDKSKIYKVIYVQNNGMNPAVVYEHEIKDPQPSRFDYAHLSVEARTEHILSILTSELNALSTATSMDGLPPSVNYRFANWEAGKTTATETPGTGFVTTPFGTWQAGDHTARARIQKINSDNGDFEILVEFMHNDPQSDAHYMRYFLVLDPVGRVLGAVRRIKGGDGYPTSVSNVLIRKGFWTPINLTIFNSLPDAEKQRCYGHRLSDNALITNQSDLTTSGVQIFARLHVRHNDAHTALDATVGNNGFWLPADPADQKYKQLNAVNIINCPHIQILTDDKLHALARCSMRLR